MARAPFEDELLDSLVGTWRVERNIRGTTVTNDATVEWVLAHQFLRIHMVDNTVPPQYEAMVFIGFNAEERRYVAHWIDVFGGSFSETLGLGTREGDSIRFVFEYPTGLLHNTFTLDRETGHWHCLIEQPGEAGAWTTFCEDEYSPVNV